MAIKLGKLISWLATVALVIGCAKAPEPPDPIARGRYLVTISGCNDCHTPDFPEKGGAVPEEQWLIGVGIGFKGTWGTTYAGNLRLLAQRLSEDEWLPHLRAQRLTPMPWYSIATMTDDDLRAMYRFIHSLGPAGEVGPAYVAPDGEVTTPYYDFMPRTD